MRVTCGPLVNRRRFFHMSRVNLGGNKVKSFLEFGNILSKTIYNYLKLGYQLKLNYKQKEISKHYGSELKGKFIDNQNKESKGFAVVTTKSVYSKKTIDGKEKINSIDIKNGNKLSKEVLLIEDKYIDKEKLNLDHDNLIIDKNSVNNLKNVLNNDLLIDKKFNNEAELYTFKLNDNILKKTRWEKIENQNGDIIYKEMKDFNSKID